MALGALEKIVILVHVVAVLEHKDEKLFEDHQKRLSWELRSERILAATAVRIEVPFSATARRHQLKLRAAFVYSPLVIPKLVVPMIFVAQCRHLGASDAQ